VVPSRRLVSTKIKHYITNQVASVTAVLYLGPKPITTIVTNKHNDTTTTENSGSALYVSYYEEVWWKPKGYLIICISVHDSC